MGIDSYLIKRVFIAGLNQLKDSPNLEVKVTGHGKPVPWLDDSKVSYVEVQVAPFGKINHIHDWFINNLPDYEEYEEPYGLTVCEADCKDLLEVCNRILTDISMGAELMPASDGSDYGPEYLWWVEYTRDIMKQLIKDIGEDGFPYRLYYQFR